MPIGMVGGSMVAGERPHDTARREAREEIGQPVRLVSSARTFIADRRGALREVRYRERPAPLLLVRRPADRRPYAGGLPTSDRWYTVAFRAIVEGRLRCELDDEVEALLWTPLTVLERGAIVSERFFASGGAIECGLLPAPFQLLFGVDLLLLAKIAARAPALLARAT